VRARSISIEATRVGFKSFIGALMLVQKLF